MTTRPNLGPHFGRTENPLTFDQIYNEAALNPAMTYQTTGNQTEFITIATVGKKGPHAGEDVLRFMSNGIERARAYRCCWGHRTNCNRTHIDIYVDAMF